MEESGYLVRFGLMHRVGLFLADTASYGRGQEVVVRTHRGTELGEVLLERPGAAVATTARILRPAAPDDLARARQLAEGRPGQLAACERILRGGDWPLEVLDVEPLLDGDRTVLHYLGPHRLDVDRLGPILCDACGLHVILEPAGIDPDAGPDDDDPAEVHGCGQCAHAAGGSEARSNPACGSCSACGVKNLLRTGATSASLP